METLYGIYEDSQQARASVARLLEGSVTNILRLGPETLAHTFEHVEEREGSFADRESAYHDVRTEREGSFGTTDSSPIDAHQRREGSFADHEPVYHDLHKERHGSFADMEVNEQLNAQNVQRALVQYGLSDDEATTCVKRMSEGATVILVQASGAVAETARSVLSG